MIALVARASIRAPRALLTGYAVAAILLSVYAVGLVDRLGLGGGEVGGSESEAADALLTAELGYDPEPPYLVSLSSAEGVASAPSRVAIAAVIGQIEALEPVSRIGVAPPSADGLTLRLSVFVANDADPAALERLGESLREGLDPGSLELAIDGWLSTQQGARDAAQSDGAMLALLALPLIAAFLVASLGWRLAPAALLAGLLAASSAVSLIGLAGVFVAIKAPAVIAAAVGGFVLAIEFGTGLSFRYRGLATVLGAGTAAIERSLSTVLRGAAIGIASVVLLVAAMLVVPIDLVRSIAVGLLAGAAAGGILGVLPLSAALALITASETDEPALPAAGKRWVNRGPAAPGSTPPLDRGGGWPVMVLPLLAIAALALPVIESEAIGLDARALPPEDPAAAAEAGLAEAFGPGSPGPLTVVTEGPLEAPDLTLYRDAISQLESVATVGRGRRVGSEVAFDAAPEAAPRSLEGLDAVRAVRAEPAPSPRRVTGPGAVVVDGSSRLAADAPLVALFALLGSAALWSLLFRSALGPLLALASVIGPLAGVAAVLIVFAGGDLTGLLDYEPLGAPHLYGLVLVAAILGAIALARSAAFATALAEDRTAGAGPPTARPLRLALMPAGVATAAGVALAGVWIGSELIPAKELAVGLSVGLLADLLLVRVMLAPAFARLSI